MRLKKFYALTIILGVLQVSVFEYLEVFEVKPELLLICVFLAGIRFRRNTALFVSFFAGVFKDVFSLGPFGLNTILFSLWSVLLTRLTRNIALDSFIVKLPLVIIISVLHNAATWITLAAGDSIISLGVACRTLIVAPLYTAAAFYLLERLNKKFKFWLWAE